MSRGLKTLLVVWLIAYPILPTSPLIAGLIAWVAGPPFVVDINASGWPIFGTITPLFVAVTIGLPWILGACLIYVAAQQPRGKSHV
jgi:hypothetical protein